MNQSAELIAAIAAIIAAIISAVSIGVSIHQGIITRQLTLKQISVNSITDKRTAWIGELRTLIGDYWGKAATLSSDLWVAPENLTIIEKNQRIEELNCLSAKITLYLNFDGDIEKIIKNNMNTIGKCLSDMASNPNESLTLQDWHSKVQLALANILACSRVLLKLEWNRIKKEADNQKYKDYDYKADKINLLNKYWTETLYKDMFDSKQLLTLLSEQKDSNN